MEVYSLLLKYKVDLNRPDRFNYTPLAYWAASGNHDALRVRWPGIVASHVC